VSYGSYTPAAAPQQWNSGMEKRRTLFAILCNPQSVNKPLKGEAKHIRLDHRLQGQPF